MPDYAARFWDLLTEHLRLKARFRDIEVAYQDTADELATLKAEQGEKS